MTHRADAGLRCAYLMRLGAPPGPSTVARSGPVAPLMGRAEVAAAVGQMVEIPSCSGFDKPSASRAQHLAGCDDRRPPFAFGLVRGVIAALLSASAGTLDQCTTPSTAGTARDDRAATQTGAGQGGHVDLTCSCSTNRQPRVWATARSLGTSADLAHRVDGLPVLDDPHALGAGGTDAHLARSVAAGRCTKVLT